MLQAWDHQVQTRPAAPSVHYFGTTLTIAQIDAAATALAVTLQHNGLQTSDRIAIYLQNDPQWLVALLAAWKCGTVPVAVNPMLRAKELRHILIDSGARAIVCLDSLYAIVLDASAATAVAIVRQPGQIYEIVDLEGATIRAKANSA